MQVLSPVLQMKNDRQQSPLTRGNQSGFFDERSTTTTASDPIVPSEEAYMLSSGMADEDERDL
jgi:hypothetical protein